MSEERWGILGLYSRDRTKEKILLREAGLTVTAIVSTPAP